MSEVGEVPVALGGQRPTILVVGNGMVGHRFVEAAVERGLHRTHRLVVVGAGKIGSALVQYRGFRQRGFDIVALFDTDPSKIGKAYDGLRVRSDAELDQVLASERPDIGVIVVPGDQAQAVADRLVRGGIRAILNFAPAPLLVPEHVSLKNVNLALELEALSFALANQER